jgi:hypothetical protein
MSDIEHWQAENARLRELYENAVGNRERFGWTINHLLEPLACVRVLATTMNSTVCAIHAIRPSHCVVQTSTSCRP